MRGNRTLMTKRYGSVITVVEFLHFFNIFDNKRYQVKYVSVISQPLASKKNTSKLHKLVKKASSAKLVKKGVKDVVKALRKGQGGLCVIAGDISPVDVISHLPGLCEDRQVPYIYVPSKLDLGAASCTKRPTSCVLISVKDSFADKELFDKMVAMATENAYATI